MSNELPRTPELERALALAAESAQARGHASVHPEHCLLALLDGPFDLAKRILRQQAIDPAKLARAARRVLEADRFLDDPSSGTLDPLIPVLELAGAMARSFGHRRSDAAHLLLAIIRGVAELPIPPVADSRIDFDQSWMVAAKIFKDFEGGGSLARPAEPGGDRASIFRRLIEDGALSPSAWIGAIEKPDINRDSILRAFVNEGQLSEWELAATLGKTLNIPFITLSHYDIEPEVIAAVPREVVQKFRVVPVDVTEGLLTVAMSAWSPEGLSRVETLTGLKVVPVITFQSDLDEAIQRYNSA